LPTTGLGSFPAGGNARQATAPCQTEVDFVKPPLPPKLKSILVPLHNRKRDSKVVISMPQDCTAVNIVRQKDNPMDPRALLCTCLSAASAKILDFDEPTNVLGYLPRQVSTHLSPLIDEDLIFLTATLRYRRTDTAILEEGASMDSVLELCATICSTKEVLQEEQHMLVASAWSAATKASEDARIGLQEVIRL
jgi:hypothetical protein